MVRGVQIVAYWGPLTNVACPSSTGPAKLTKLPSIDSTYLNAILPSTAITLRHLIFLYLLRVISSRRNTQFLQAKEASTEETLTMPFIPTSQEWLTQSALLLEARPTTVRCHLPPLPPPPPLLNHGTGTRENKQTDMSHRPPPPGTSYHKIQHQARKTPKSKERRRRRPRRRRARGGRLLETAARDPDPQDLRPPVGRVPEVQDDQGRRGVAPRAAPGVPGQEDGRPARRARAGDRPGG